MCEALDPRLERYGVHLEETSTTSSVNNESFSRICLLVLKNVQKLLYIWSISEVRETVDWISRAQVLFRGGNASITPRQSAGRAWFIQS